jgi:DNA-binding NarL/FixJ family response regulator
VTPDHDDAVIVILDIQMPVEEGLNTIAVLRGRSPRLRIVVCSFHCEAATRQRALAHRADAYLVKPVGAADLKRVLQRLPDERPPGSRAPVRNHPCWGHAGPSTTNPDNLAIWSLSTTGDQRHW